VFGFYARWGLIGQLSNSYTPEGLGFINSLLQQAVIRFAFLSAFCSWLIIDDEYTGFGKRLLL
jgi:hypothetical protein